ncbi:MAG: hypothetical protein M0Z28_29030 [Rhodospirillales bacterium]|nr:hypothetical protein [Rhodospirillales bacterium]
MMAALIPLRRALAGAQPPTTAARQRLAEAITAKAEANERLRVLAAVQPRAYAAMEAAEAALPAAREEAEQASRRAHEHNIAALLGSPPPAVPSRRDAAAKLAAAEEAVTDAEAAWRQIAGEATALRDGAADRERRITEAAAAVLADEAQDAAAKLIADITDLHCRLVDRGRALMWLWRQNVVRLHGVGASEGAPDVRMMLAFPTDQAPLWNVASASPTEAAWAAALEALKLDAMAEVPK